MGTHEVTTEQLAHLANRLEKGHWDVIAHSVCLDLLAGYAYFYQVHFMVAPAWAESLLPESKGAQNIITLMPKPRGERSFEHCLTEVKAAAQLLMSQELGLPRQAESYDASTLSDEESDAVRSFLDSDDAYGIMRSVVAYAVQLQQWEDANTALTVIRRETGEVHPEFSAPTMPDNLKSMIQRVQANES